VCPTTPTGHTSSVLLRGTVQLFEKGAAFNAGGPLHWVDLHSPHPGKVDDQASVAGREAGHTVSSAADRNDEIGWRAKRTALMTSSTRVHRAMSAG
jgi:hypothetical protein